VILGASLALLIGVLGIFAWDRRRWRRSMQALRLRADTNTSMWRFLERSSKNVRGWL